MSGQHFKKIIILSLLFCLIVPIIYYQAILSNLFTWSLQKYMVSHWDSPLRYEGIHYKNGRLMLIKPFIDQGIHYEAEKMSVSFDFDIRKRELFVEIILDAPTLSFQSFLSSPKEKIAKLIDHEDKWFKVVPKLTINQGQIKWVLADNSQHEAVFDLEADSSNGIIAKLGLTPSRLLYHDLILHISSQKNEITAACLCQNLCCRELKALGQFLGLDNSSLELLSGSLSGEVTGYFPFAERPYLEGEILVENLHVKESSIQLSGRIEKAFLKLDKNQQVYDSHSKLPTVIGKVNIEKAALFSYESDSKKWFIDNIKGDLLFNEESSLLVNLEGLAKEDIYQEKEEALISWSLQGKTNLNSAKDLNVNLELCCSSPGYSDGNIHFMFGKGSNKSEYLAVMQLKSLSYKVCDFLQTMLAPYLPIMNKIKWEKGELNALVEASLTEKGMGEVHVRQFQVDNLNMFIKPWGAASIFGQIEGHGSAHLGEEDFWDSLEAELHVENGEMEWPGKQSALPLKGIQAQILYQHGKMDHSLITLRLGNLNGILDLEWGNLKKLFNLKLTGKVQDLANLFPAHLQEGLRNNFHQKSLVILANLEKHPGHFELSGTAHIPGDKQDQNAFIHFGCEWRKIDEVLRSSFVPHGRFYTHDLPLEKYISPFLFRDGVLQMSGSADLKGEFDGKFLTVLYNAQNVKIENDNLCMEAKYLRSPEAGGFLGFHEIDLEKKCHRGTLPIQDATYLEKNSGLYFKDIQGVVTIENQSLKWSPVEASCEGVYFGGEIAMDYSDPAPGVFSVSVACPSFFGKILHIQQLLGKMNEPSFLQKIPLEGECTAREEGISLHFDFFPKNHHLLANLKGRIIGGGLPFVESDMMIKEIDMDIDYDHLQDRLNFSDIQGTLLVGEPRWVEEYSFTGNHICLSRLSDPDFTIDIAFSDGEDELFRLAASSETQGEGFHRIDLDLTLSHLSGIFPKNWECTVKDWTTLITLSSHYDVNIDVLMNDLFRFQRTGLSCLSSKLIEQLNQKSPIGGEGNLALRYHPEDLSFLFDLHCNGIKQGGCLHVMKLEGRKMDEKWMIDHFQWNDWSAYAEFEKNENSWKIPFLGLKSNDSFLVGLTGEYDEDNSRLLAKVNFCEVDLNSVSQWKSVEPLLKKWKPKGHIKAVGEIVWDLSGPVLQEGLSGMMEVSSHDLHLRNYPLLFSKPFGVALQKGEGFRFNGLRLELAPKNSQAFLEIAYLTYHPETDDLNCPQALFHIPQSSLYEVGLKFHENFPDYFDAPSHHDFVNLNLQNGLGGNFTWDENGEKHALHLRLDDGWYPVNGNQYDCKQIEINVLQNVLYFSALAKQERLSFQATGQISWPAREQGNLKLKDLTSTGNIPSHQLLIINWEKLSNQPMTLRSVQGDFSGCSFNLMGEVKRAELPDLPHLIGHVRIDPNLLTSSLPAALSDKIKELKLGSSYVLEGDFWTNFDLGPSLLETVFFRGRLTGKDICLKGYQFESMEGDVQYTPGRFLMQNYSIRDKAGSLLAPHFFLDYHAGADRWTFNIPQVNIKNLQPALLHDLEPAEAVSNSKFRSLLIKRMELTQLNGQLDEADSWVGKGYMHFLNASRKNNYHPLLAIPAEIILRLGLDPQVLNPVTGTIYFDLKEGRFYLTRFKDVYSEGRGSKFYLAEGVVPSWMDFDGNLSVQIRMKHYNLIFKLAELFTVSVQGNIKKPRYTLQKQSKAPR